MEAVQHPGSVTYLDGNTGAVVATRDIGDVPESMRFVDTPAGPVPVVRVVATVVGSERLIQEFGPEDALLRTTRQVDESAR